MVKNKEMNDEILIQQYTFHVEGVYCCSLYKNKIFHNVVVE